MVVSYQPKEFHRLADLHTTCLEDLFSLCFTRLISVYNTTFLAFFQFVCLHYAYDMIHNTTYQNLTYVSDAFYVYFGVYF